MNFGMIILNQNIHRKHSCVTWTQVALLFILTEDFYKDIANDVGKWFDTSDYNKNDKRPLPIGKNKKVIVMFKDELGGKIIEKICGHRAKTYAYKLNDNSECKKAKGIKKCVIKRTL